jgi:hypothetical protein
MSANLISERKNIAGNNTLPNVILSMTIKYCYVLHSDHETLK